jgi:hypothetical protein
MKDVQKTATKVFITASVLFGLIGIAMVLTPTDDGEPMEWMAKLLFMTGCVVLSSFGVSVGYKYLSGK